MNKINIYDLNKDELAAHLSAMGEPTFRASQIFKALHNGTPITDISNISKQLRERLAAEFYCNLPTIEKEQVSKDGTRKFLLQLSDGALVECVLLTQDYGNTVCLSSQVGCKMGCIFCASGKNGFVRNLSAGEMLYQILLLNAKSIATSQKPISNIVVMGSGEPFDNFDNTIKFLQLVTHPDGINVGARNISVSTVGLPDQIRQFSDLNMQVNLCISLHAPNDTIRKGIVPMAKRHQLPELIAAAKYFFNKTHRRVIFEYALIDNVNCAPEHAVELAKLLRGFPNHVNLINLNKGTGDLQPPTRETAMKFMDTLIKNNVSCTMRKSRGGDIDGACGQLRTKFVKCNTKQ